MSVKFIKNIVRVKKKNDTEFKQIGAFGFKDEDAEEIKNDLEELETTVDGKASAESVQNIADDVESLQTKVSHIEPDDTTFFIHEKSINLLNVDNLISGYINTSNGSISSNANYKCTEYYIPVESGATYRYQYNMNGVRYDAISKSYSSVTYTAFYDINKNFMSGCSSNSWKYIVAPTNAAYMRVTMAVSTLTNTLYSEFAIVKSAESIVYPYQDPTYEATIIKSEYLGGINTTHCYLPSDLYVAVGTTVELYNNLVCLEADKYHVSWLCDIGTQFERKYTITGTSSAIGNHTLYFKLYLDSMQVLLVKKTTIHIVNNVVADNHKVLPIGDSLTNQKSWLGEVETLSDNKINFIGTRRAVGYSISHEGRSGVSAEWYSKQSTYTFDNNYVGNPSLQGNTNPFWDGNKFSLKYYIDNQSDTIGTPDAVNILLGTNALSENPSFNVACIKKIIDNIKAEYPTMPIFVCNTIYRSRQDGYGSVGNDAYTPTNGNFQFNEDVKIMKLQNALHDTFSEYSNVYIVPMSITMDRDNDFGFSEININSRSNKKTYIPVESIHPQNEGYMQMADVLFSTCCGAFANQ